MAANAELFGVGFFHTGVKAAPEDNPRREADKQQRTERHTARTSPPLPDPADQARFTLLFHIIPH